MARPAATWFLLDLHIQQRRPRSPSWAPTPQAQPPTAQVHVINQVGASQLRREKERQCEPTWEAGVGVFPTVASGLMGSKSRSNRLAPSWKGPGASNLAAVREKSSTSIRHRGACRVQGGCAIPRSWGCKRRGNGGSANTGCDSWLPGTHRHRQFTWGPWKPKPSLFHSTHSSFPPGQMSWHGVSTWCAVVKRFAATDKAEGLLL